MRFDVLTLFPEVFPAYLDASIIGRARKAGKVDVRIWNIRNYATDKHKTVDDTPYGGGAGMVMKVAPIDRALQAVSSGLRVTGYGLRKTVVLSARGIPFTQKKAEEYATLDQLVLICGRYEGIDQRVADYLADEELSIGPYVLAGGELAALVVVEAVARLIPGVLGNVQSLKEESFGLAVPASQASEASEAFAAHEASVEYPQYTKPEDYKGWKVPGVLLSGNHEEIRKWREEQRKK